MEPTASAVPVLTEEGDGDDAQALPPSGEQQEAAAVQVECFLVVGRLGRHCAALLCIHATVSLDRC